MQQLTNNTRIINYEPGYQADFKRLNEEWITTWFTLEDSDRKVLDHPDENILSKGGHIFIAINGDEPVGACALVRVNEHTFEMAKMAVSPKVQGQGIGHRLGMACIAKVRQLGATKIYLESNSVLKPALALYQKLGFKTVTGISSPYQRCNVQMELAL